MVPLRIPETKLISGVYAIKSIEGTVYIGGSGDIHGRIGRHRRRLYLKQHEVPELQSDYNRLGIDGFSFCLLKAVPGDCYHREQIEKCEAQWIARFLRDGVKLYNRDLKKTQGAWRNRKTKSK